MGGLSVEMKLCRGDCSLVVSSEKFASPFTLAVEQTCANVEHHIYSIFPPLTSAKSQTKKYNSGDSLVVTHLTTNPPVHCLSTAERTGSADFSVLWSYVE